MNERSLRVLEFTKIRAQLAQMYMLHCILLKSVPRFRRARCWISASAFGPPERRGMRL